MASGLPVIPAHAMVKLRDIVLQPGAKTPDNMMKNDMICHMTEGELSVVQNERSSRSRRATFGPALKEYATEGTQNTSNAVAIMRIIDLMDRLKGGVRRLLSRSCQREVMIQPGAEHAHLVHGIEGLARRKPDHRERKFQLGPCCVPTARRSVLNLTYPSAALRCAGRSACSIHSLSFREATFVVFSKACPR